jgi:hypothetical protein
MKLQTVAPPDRGSLSIVYACPECGYEMAMLTNAYETQVVQSLGVRIGPESDTKASDRLRAEGASASRTGASAEADASACPFAEMIPAIEGSAVGAETPIRWTAAAEARLANIPGFVRPMARTGIERFAREHGALEVDEKILDAAREFFGM